jgi:hypothetical protein
MPSSAENARLWKARNPGRRAEINRQSDRRRKERDPLKYAWKVFVQNLRARVMESTLTRQQHDAICLGSCEYCGREAIPTNGIDRVDNLIGYVDGNVVSCCKTCNYMKGTLCRESFIEQVARIAARMGI